MILRVVLSRRRLLPKSFKSLSTIFFKGTPYYGAKTLIDNTAQWGALVVRRIIVQPTKKQTKSIFAIYSMKRDKVIRQYREVGSSKIVAGIIAREVIESGKSVGWQGV